MLPVDPSSFSLSSIILAPFHIAYDLVHFTLLCVKCIFDGAYEFFLGPSEDKKVALVIDPNLVAINQEERKELCQKEKRRWDEILDRVALSGVQNQRVFDLTSKETFSMDEVLQIKQVDTNQEANLCLTVRLPKSQLSLFPHDIRVRLKEFDKDQELEIYFVIYDMGLMGGKTFNFLYGEDDIHVSDLFTGVCHSQGLEPLTDRGITFGQFSPSKLRAQNHRFRFDEPYGSFFTGAQFVNDQGHNYKGMGIFGIAVRDWDNMQARNLSLALREKSLRNFLTSLQDSNFVYYHNVSSLFTYNENYYFTGV